MLHELKFIQVKTFSIVRYFAEMTTFSQLFCMFLHQYTLQLVRFKLVNTIPISGNCVGFEQGVLSSI